MHITTEAQRLFLKHQKVWEELREIYFCGFLALWRERSSHTVTIFPETLEDKMPLFFFYLTNSFYLLVIIFDVQLQSLW